MRRKNYLMIKFPKAFIEYLEEHNDAELEVNTLDIGDNECCIRFFMERVLRRTLIFV